MPWAARFSDRAVQSTSLSHSTYRWRKCICHCLKATSWAERLSALFHAIDSRLMSQTLKSAYFCWKAHLIKQEKRNHGVQHSYGQLRSWFTVPPYIRFIYDFPPQTACCGAEVPSFLLLIGRQKPAIMSTDMFHPCHAGEGIFPHTWPILESDFLGYQGLD